MKERFNRKAKHNANRERTSGIAYFGKKDSATWDQRANTCTRLE
jgi:hypothetical protein